MESLKALKRKSAVLGFGSTPVTLSDSGINPGSVIVSDDISCFVVYEEGVDYSVGYSLGIIVGLSGTRIPENKEVQIWYEKKE